MYKYINIFFVALKLGLLSFGGPTAHLGYFYDEYVKKRKWLDEKEYSDLVALCQFLPGPASSQVGIGIGTIRAGIGGGIISFIGFTLPSVIILMIFSALFTNSDVSFTWMQGLKLVAVAIVGQAIIGMGKKLTNTKTTIALALFVLILSLVINNLYIQVIALSITGVYGLIFLKQTSTDRTKIKNKSFKLPKKLGFVSLLLFFLLLTVLPIASSMTNNLWLKMFDSFYRSGSLVFGGGHVVLPLLKNEFVPSGLISPDNFITGYAAAQAVPGPLFTFASYIGMSMEGIGGAILATIAIFLPAFLLLFGILPFWDNIKSNIYAEGFLKGISAGVVGILIAAFYNPIWTSTIKSELDFALASSLFILLMYFKLPSWAIVLIGIILGVLFY
ncbi:MULTISPECIES: chromate efflux transporter [Staphylococcus]|uniref:Chromate transporter, chromate ion transporter (CHR) family n=1 Tax=Staphylococcus saprophyticus TaxID=29385 RepID=A0A380HJ74_STASA|nr:MULTISPECIES: chromate efflux transporter [Staphylococcus]TGP60388.1 chromate efflux transporter [bacterium M00.F.Ca.ET.229.01.1.1]TGS37004.1 chromate efflux transporter [bacterium M00.F.Ca.ET.180.01.1.1]AVL77113.1 ChrA protein [Staphylococcus cohnii]MBN6091830.1 chromate efflux transporter [Staphylococcus saprophyticus]MDE1710958.1 chromate efflux transporter [Staphylococcus cohnii]